MPESTPATFRAMLLRDGKPPRVLTLPSRLDVPPNRVRIPAEFAGASAFDVFELADDRAWPAEATYQLVATIPRSTEDVPPETRAEWDVTDLDSDEEPLG
ncbi:hypothetical protein ACRAWB_18785 [Leifsonia poae]|uniref:hypothetical protein n=1 Tax=Leifsonia poae TaxID=110933 RepID=UPI003D695380